ncbi:hypothetical protein PAXRUDRAFT_56004, partial [Paxillus rubicundulus Ve08.2h10]
MSSTTTQDDLKIPKLDATRKNWLTWKVKLEHALGAKRLKGYLNGTVLMPTHPAEWHLPAWIPTMTAEELEVADYERAFKSWDEKDCMVKHYIGSSIPNTLFIHLHSKTTGTKYFEALCKQFKSQSIA